MMNRELASTLSTLSFHSTHSWAVIYLLECFTLLGLGGVGRNGKKEVWWLTTI